jgi:hypothetical protein
VGKATVGEGFSQHGNDTLTITVGSAKVAGCRTRGHVRTIPSPGDRRVCRGSGSVHGLAWYGPQLSLSSASDVTKAHHSRLLPKVPVTLLSVSNLAHDYTIGLVDALLRRGLEVEFSYPGRHATTG